jgi:hypothetical protein
MTQFALYMPTLFISIIVSYSLLAGSPLQAYLYICRGILKVLSDNREYEIRDAVIYSDKYL